MTYISIDYALANGHGEWRSFTCPTHNDVNPSARVNAKTGKWVCMVCHAKGKSHTYEPPQEYVLNQIKNLSLDEEDNKSPESLYDLYRQISFYWLSRFTEKACDKFELGWDSANDQPVYPLRDPLGAYLGIVRRNEHGKPKYKYPKNVRTSSLLFGYHFVEQKREIVLVEGAPDVIALWEAGVPAVGSFGARLYEDQCALLARLEPLSVMVAYDMDEAGRIGSQEAVRTLREHGIPARRMGWPEYKDPGEMPVEIRREIFSVALDYPLAQG